jgi:hypothetical protein
MDDAQRSVEEYYLPKRIEAAQDQFGVITADAFHSELEHFRPEEWQLLGKIYPKQNSNPEGFYIVDNGDQEVVIHNDTRKAAASLKQGFFSSTWHALTENPLKIAGGTSLGVAPGFYAGGLTGALATESTFACTVSGGIGAVLISGAIGGAVLGHLRDQRKDVAHKDLINNQELHFPIRQHL